MHEDTAGALDDAGHKPAPVGAVRSNVEIPEPAPASQRWRGLSAALLLLLAIGLVPAMLGTAWYLRHMRDLAVADAFAQADLLAVGTTERLRWLMQDAESMLGAIAQRPQVRALDPTHCDPVFRDFGDFNTSYRALSLRRLDGSSVCSELARPPTSAAVAGASWFRGAIAQAGFHVTGVHAGTVEQRWTARLTHPVRDEAGRTHALLITPIDLAQLRQRLFGQLPPSANAAVVDGDNLVVVRSTLQDERVGKTGAPGVVRELQALRATEGFDRRRSQSRQFAEISIDGTRRLFSVRNVPGTDWAVVIALPESEALQPYLAQRNRSLVAIALVLLLAALAAWRVSRAILVPVRGLAGAARDLAEGRVVQAAPESGPAEIRDVAREFNRMVQVTAEGAERLRASEMHHRQLIELLPVAVITYDADGALETLNPGATSLLPGGAWHFLDAQGVPLPPSQHPVQRVLRTGRPMAARSLAVASDTPVAGPAGEPTWVLVTAHPQFDAAERVQRVILVMVDVTTQHHAERFRVAKEAAEAASRAKSAFLSRVSHELRTPLNAINGFSELLQRDERLAPDMKVKVGHVLSAGRHLLSLIDQILDLTRVETGPLPLQSQPVALWPLLEECLAICGPLAQSQHVTLELQPLSEEPAPWVQGNPTRLRQILMNLLSNGIKYNRPGGSVRINVQPLPPAPGAPDLAVHVCDTGIGLDAQQIAGLFQPFSRLGAEHRGIEGHGLGLMISRMLAHSMRGDIAVRSVAGEGSCFSLHLHRTASGSAPLPAPVAEGTAEAAPAGDADAPRAAPGTRRRRRVLCIEDNALNMALLRQILSLRDDIVVHEATDGLAGVQAVHEVQPDLVLIDLGLPTLDGFGVLERIKRNPATSAIPCWAVTADTTAATAERAARLGFERLLTKPVSVSAMLGALEAWAPPGGS